MKYMIIRKADKDTEAGKMPSDELLMAMGKYNESLINAGVLVDGTGLKPSSQGARIKFHQGKPVITDGPFTETREILAGFTMIETGSHEEALEWVKKWPVEDADGEVELELRPVYGMEDFAPGAGLEVHADNARKLALQPSSAIAYLPFADGKCREAFEFYADCLGGEIDQMLAWGDMGMPDLPEAMKPRISHASMRMGKCQLAGVDLITEEQNPNTGGNVVLGFDTPEKTRTVFEKLAAGGEVKMKPEATFWSSCFAMVTDKYGVHWMLNCEQPPAVAAE